MLINNFAATAVLVFTLLARPALGSPVDLDDLPPGLASHLESRASDVTVKFWKNTCRTSRSKKSFNSGHCIKSLNPADVAVSMQSRKRASCHMIRYKEKECTGHSEKGLNLHDCFNIAEDWQSMKFKC